jgi:hypothetical protein
MLASITVPATVPGPAVAVDGVTEFAPSAMLLDRPGASDEAMIDQLRLRDASLTFRFSMDRLPGGGGGSVAAYLRARAQGAYLAQVIVGRRGRLALAVTKYRSGRTSRLGRPVFISGWRYQAGKDVQVRVMAVKQDPTQVRMKAWPAGTQEPRRWQLVRNDARARDLQGAGVSGFRTQLKASAINAPVNVQINGITLGDASSASYVPVSTSDWVTVQSLGRPRTPGDTTPPTIRAIEVPNVTRTSATVSWTLSERATGQIRFGQTEDYGRESTRETGFGYSTHRQTISGLQPGTIYHFQVVSTDRAGNTAASSDQTFTTLAAATPDPTPRTDPTTPPDPTPTPAPTTPPAPTPTPALPTPVPPTRRSARSRSTPRRR